MPSSRPLNHIPDIPGENRRRVTTAVTVLVSILTIGVCGLMTIEGWDFWTAFFFTIVTVTTVGYGDEGISQAGERFTALLMVGGIGTASYTFALVVQAMVTNQLAWRRRMQTRIDKLEDHVLVCGFGRMGRILCEELRDADTEFVVIECDSSSATEALELGYPVVQGSATEDEILILAGVMRAGHLVCAMNRESENIVATLSARQLRPDLSIIARAEQPEEIRKLRLAGATRTVAPFHLGGLEIATAITRPKVADFLAASSRSESHIVLAEILIESDSHLCGCCLRDCGSKEASHVSFVTLERRGEDPQTPPRGSTQLQGGDLLIVAGAPEEVRWMRSSAKARKGIRQALPRPPEARDADPVPPVPPSLDEVAAALPSEHWDEPAAPQDPDSIGSALPWEHSGEGDLYEPEE